MRWWLEALLRGVGGSAPDPVAHPSVFDSRHGETGGLDPASLLFGATGYRRRFRLMVTSKVSQAPVDKVEFRELSHPVLNDRGQPVSNPDGTPKLKVPTWFFNSTPVKGTLVLQVTPLHEDCNAPLVSDLLSFMAKWGTLGARAQMGFGVAKAISGETGGDALLQFLKDRQGKNGADGMPALHQMFFARVAGRGGVVLDDRDTFLLKHDIRRLFTNRDLRHEVMGWVDRDQRQGARIHMSRPYGSRRAIRLWGWVPERSASGKAFDRNRDVLDKIHAYFSSGRFQLESWRECDSPRDEVAKRGESPVDFFDRLRKEAWQ
jgi:CRISPR-associated protein Cmr1